MRATQFWSVPEEAGPLRSGTYPTTTRPWLHWPTVRECSLGRARLLLVGLNGISRSAVALRDIMRRRTTVVANEAKRTCTEFMSARPNPFWQIAPGRIPRRRREVFQALLQ